MTSHTTAITHGGTLQRDDRPACSASETGLDPNRLWVKRGRMLTTLCSLSIAHFVPKIFAPSSVSLYNHPKVGSFWAPRYRRGFKLCMSIFRSGSR